MATNLLMFTSSYDIRRFAAYDRWTISVAGKFLGVRRIFAQISPDSPKKLKKTAFHFLLGGIFSNHTTSSTIFAQISPKLAQISPNLPKKRDLQKTTSALWFWEPFLQIQTTYSNFVKVFTHFARFPQILPGFSPNQNFWGCGCTLASYTSALNAEILAGHAARQWLLVAVSRDAGERRYCPLTFRKGGNGGGGVFYITASKIIFWFIKIELKKIFL